MPPRLRLLHVCPRYSPAPGGVELFFSKLSATLAARGHQVSVWTTDARELRAFSRREGATFPAGPSVIDGVAVRRFSRSAPAVPPVADDRRASAAPWPVLGRSTFRWNPFVRRWPRGSNARGQVRHRARRGAAVQRACWTSPAAQRHARVHVSCSARSCMWAIPRTRRQRVRRVYLSPTNVALLRQADLVLVQTTVERDALSDAGVRPDRMRLVGMGSMRPTARAVTACGVARGGPSAAEPVVGHLANKSADREQWTSCSPVRGFELPAFPSGCCWREPRCGVTRKSGGTSRRRTTSWMSASWTTARSVTSSLRSTCLCFRAM